MAYVQEKLFGPIVGRQHLPSGELVEAAQDVALYEAQFAVDPKVIKFRAIPPEAPAHTKLGALFVAIGTHPLRAAGMLKAHRTFMRRLDVEYPGELGDRSGERAVVPLATRILSDLSTHVS